VRVVGIEHDDVVGPASLRIASLKKSSLVSGASFCPYQRNLTVVGRYVRAGAMRRVRHGRYAASIRACQRKWSSIKVAMKK
jgi:hypothetical protein